jgi:glyceraldehyde 3-phosphate dehydrogenase
MRIAINGFGRIGRCVARALLKRQSSSIELVAINDLAHADTLKHLFKYDSVHGKINTDPFNTVIWHQEKNPLALPWKELGIDVVLECSGAFTSRDTAMQHITAGAKRVIVSAPCSNADKTIVYGVNHMTLTTSDLIVSNASCTTNCLAPIAYLLNDLCGIEHGFMMTVHSYTQDQRLHDAPHKDLYRARAAALSMIPTTTGAAKAIGLVIPALSGKLEGMSVRVPTANVSLIDLTFVSVKPTTMAEINNHIKSKAQGNWASIIEYVEEPLVSVDFNGNPHSASFVPAYTQVIDGHLCRVLAWYDNEWGFSNRMLDVVKYASFDLAK